MDQTQIKFLLDSSMNGMFWWAVSFGIVMFFKNAIENMVWGMTFLFSRDYNVDDEFLVGGMRKARIIRQTISKTVLYFYDSNTCLVVPNKEMHSMKCEKILSGSKMSQEH